MSRRKLALELLGRLVPPNETERSAREGARSAIAAREQALLSDPKQNMLHVVAGMRSSFRRCYLDQLGRDPKGEYRGRLNFTIDPDGAVSSATVVDMPPQMASCIEAVARAARFLPLGPEKPTNVQLPLQFVKQ